MSALNTVLSQLDKVQRVGNDKYKALCPAHNDKSPSLAIKDSDGKLLLHCFAGCQTEDVLAAIGLDFNDIMPEKSNHNFTRDKKPFYALEILRIIKLEATLVSIFASDMSKGLALNSKDKTRLLLATSRINHAYEVAKNGL